MKRTATNSKRRLLKRLRSIIDESEQLARDMEWWNENRTDCPPFDAGPSRMTAHHARMVVRLIESNQPVPRELLQRVVGCD